jgi:PAT family beta-lactamase induction signal transducer AmpG
LHIALPAWLAVEGVSASRIAGFLGIIMLPWAFKLLVGPLMDHFEFLPMGKRRPWVLGAQFGMVVSLLALMWVEDPVAQFGLLTAIGFAINAFTATQDVAVDGMSIDLVPVEQEGRLNAFMSFGKSVGWAVTSAVTGTLLVAFGMKVTALVCAVGAAAVFVYLVMVRERHTERLLPWSKGEASPKNEPPPVHFLHGSVAGITSWTQNYALKGFLVFLLLLAILMFRSHGHPEEFLEEKTG